MMHFWLLISFLTWMVKCNAEESSSDSIFSVMPVGSSGLLIYWDPNNFAEDLADDTKVTLFRFDYFIKGQENRTQPRVKVRRTEVGQVMIDYLLENATYHIAIIKFISNGYVIEGKTNLKTNSPPAKPDFSLQYLDKKFLTACVMWLPCGLERDCQGLEAGTPFYITYKNLKTGKEIKQDQFSYDVNFINFLLPGIRYVVTVSSINGNFVADSDPREIFFEPFTGPVQSVEVTSENTTNNSSVMISWKPPKRMGKAIHSYGVCYYPLNSQNSTWDELPWREQLLLSRCQVTYADKSKTLFRLEIEISEENKLQRSADYRFLIIPYSDQFYSHSGLVYELDYRMP